MQQDPATPAEPETEGPPRPLGIYAFLDSAGGVSFEDQRGRPVEIQQHEGEPGIYGPIPGSAMAMLLKGGRAALADVAAEHREETARFLEDQAREPRAGEPGPDGDEARGWTTTSIRDELVQDLGCAIAAHATARLEDDEVAFKLRTAGAVGTMARALRDVAEVRDLEQGIVVGTASLNHEATAAAGNYAAGDIWQAAQRAGISIEQTDRLVADLQGVDL